MQRDVVLFNAVEVVNPNYNAETNTGPNDYLFRVYLNQFFAYTIAFLVFLLPSFLLRLYLQLFLLKN